MQGLSTLGAPPSRPGAAIRPCPHRSARLTDLGEALHGDVPAILQHNQRINPPDFHYAFNLGYGQKYMDAHPLLLQIRALLDADTQSRQRATGA